MTARATTAPGMPAHAERGTPAQPAAPDHRHATAGRGGRVPATAVVVGGLVAVACAVGLSLLVGTQPVAPTDVVAALTGGAVSEDVAGIVASRRANGPVATIAIDKMEFLAPINLRDLISVYANVERVGRTSMAIRIEVVATRDRGTTDVKVTEGVFTFVALDEQHRPMMIDSAS